MCIRDRYDRFMRKDRAAYDEMYKLIRPVVRHKTVLEPVSYTHLDVYKRQGLNNGTQDLRL